MKSVDFLLIIIALVVFFCCKDLSWSDVFYRSPLVIDSSSGYYDAFARHDRLSVSWTHLNLADKASGTQHGYSAVKVVPLNDHNDDPIKPWRTVVFFHANDAHLGSPNVVDHVVRLASGLQAAVYCMEYIGYGISELGGANTAVSQELLSYQALDFFDFVVSDAVRHDHAPKIIVHGHSLGAAVASSVSANVYKRHSPVHHDLILEGGWTSVQQWIGNYLPWAMVRLVCPIRNKCLHGNSWDTVSALNERSLLLLKRYGLYGKEWPQTVIVVGEEDSVTPPYMARELFKLNEPLHSQLVTLHGMHHSDTYMDKTYITKLNDALALKSPPNDDVASTQ